MQMEKVITNDGKHRLCLVRLFANFTSIFAAVFYSSTFDSQSTNTRHVLGNTINVAILIEGNSFYCILILIQYQIV